MTKEEKQDLKARLDNREMVSFKGEDVYLYVFKSKITKRHVAVLNGTSLFGHRSFNVAANHLEKLIKKYNLKIENHE